jgi:hypothetical protein
MPKRFITALLFIFILSAASVPAYCYWGGLGMRVSPPAGESDTGSMLVGTTRSISHAKPSSWAECKMQHSTYPPFGYYSNQVYYDAADYRYRFYIWISSPLSNGTNTIPTSSIKYMLTSVYNFYETGDWKNGTGPGLKQNYQTYVPFSDTPDEIYYASDAIFPGAITAEVPTYPSKVVSNFQFLYAIETPDNLPPGTYSGTISYQVVRDGEGIDTATCPFNITVDSVFKMSVDRGTIDFEKMKPGDTKDNMPVEGVIATCTSSNGNPWYLKVSNDAPLSNGPFMIPNSNFIWYGYTEGSGTWYGTGTDPLSLVPMLMYASGPLEGLNIPAGTKNHLKFKLSIPKGQAGGKYISNVRLTMTE